MKTNEHEASRLLALDALAFADQISPGWDVERQNRHLREQIALAKGYLEGESASEYTLIKSVTPAMVEAAEDAFISFDDMEEALNSAIAVAREAGQ